MAQPDKCLRNRLLTLTVGAVVLFQAGCEREAPRTYRIPKEDRPEGHQTPHRMPEPVPSPEETATSGGMPILPGMRQDAAGAGNLVYSVPDGWEEFPAQGVRQANFRIAEEGGAAEVTVLAFPGEAGGYLANVNRWAGQLGMGSLTEARLEEISERYRISGKGGLWVRLEGEGESILGAILPFGEATWFFKMQGDEAAVRRHEGTMQAFLDSVRLEESAGD